MGLVYADVELINGEDLSFARKNIIGEDEIKRMHVNLLVDTGSYMLAINENIQEQLQFPVVEKRKAQLANGHIVECDVVSHVELKFKNRSQISDAIVLPGNAQALIGASRLENIPTKMPYVRLK